MKNYREVIRLSIFSGPILLASVEGDAIKFDKYGDVFIYTGKRIVGHVPAESVGKLAIDSKRVIVFNGYTVFHVNYWLNA